MGLLESVSIFNDNHLKETMYGIMEELRVLYLRDSKPFIVMFSAGKDSSLTLTLIWRMLQSLPAEKRTKLVHVISGATKVETPSATVFLHKTLNSIETEAKKQGLPIQVYLAVPDLTNSFFYQVLGKGNPPPNTKSRFRWCSDRLKIQATDRVVKRILDQVSESRGFLEIEDDPYDVIMHLGVRSSESINRKNSIKRHQIDDTKFARHAVHNRVLVYHPIKTVDKNDLWDYLLMGGLPWGDVHELVTMYQLSDNECPLTSPDGKQQKSCGQNRMGCWVCCYLDGPDKMLVNLINAGDNTMRPLFYWKKTLQEMRNDARYREPFQKRVLKRQSTAEVNYVNLLDFSDADDWELEGPETGYVYQPGSFTLEARKVLLKYLLHIQAETGYTLIENEEIFAILEAWKEEGYIATPSDIEPEDFKYDGALVLNKNGTINVKETTIKQQVFMVEREFEEPGTWVIDSLKQRRTATNQHVFYMVKELNKTHVQFVVCDKNVENIEEAEMFIDEWIGDTSFSCPN